MKVRFATLVAAAIATGMPAFAQELFFPSMVYRTGPFAASGIPLADGYADYFTMLNERDGGIGGVKIKLTECETSYNTEKGVECYEGFKGQKPLLIQPNSTGIAYQLIPKVEADGLTMLTPGLGRTSVKNGAVFRNTFNFPSNYWDGASIIIKHLLAENGDDLKGKKITLLYHNSAYGKEPIRTLEELSKKHGFEFNTLPVDSPGQEQKSQWLQIRRDRPDFVIMWGWGVMNSAAIQEAANVRYPMENIYGSWWSGSENDVRPAGDGANGYKSLNMHGANGDYPIFADVAKYVKDAGKAAGAGDQIGSIMYLRGVYEGALAHLAVLKAQADNNTKEVTPAMMRDALEGMEVTEEIMAGLGLPNFAPPFKATCENHGGDGYALIQQWDAKAGKWSAITDWIQSDLEVIDPLVKADSEAYAKEAGITPKC
ncbi:ABC transporter substrate-binding protein [Falsigemmobacter faecalis]|uniref:ABC transporter permease n=1 Tax=Falsigemmobacter faecalis TaxID=2488730 RepID=A0A3P3DUR5_9RHOB|nr:ABC transporter substrate-binding protein [Falsigemmobacter faecalis]RRH77970.1 ABC transporter permease [Falsigemmobacter faecalis]